MGGLDELLLHSVRLLIMSALVTGDVYLTGYIGDAAGVPRLVLTRHIRRLRDAEYVRTWRGTYGKQWLQRTPAGRKSFVEHIAALRALIDAGENIGHAAPPDAIYRVNTNQDR